MTKQGKIVAAEKEKPTGLALMREPFPANQISKLPKPTRAQTDEVRKDFTKGIRCEVCGQWHHPKVVHLDYVGHAALTDRLLDCDPEWNWEPIAKTEHGTPLFDQNGGMWINLTVCGVTRMGYGHPDGKSGGDALKEVIGDALRNAAMRFGAALDLWHKGDLHADDAPEPGPEPDRQIGPTESEWFGQNLPKVETVEQINGLLGRAKKAGRDVSQMVVDRANELGFEFDPQSRAYAEPQPANADLADEIPY